MGVYRCMHCDELKESRDDGYHDVPNQGERPPSLCCGKCFDSLECDYCGQGFEDESGMVNHNGRLFHNMSCLVKWQKDLR